MTCRHSPGDPNCGSHPSNVYARATEDAKHEAARLKNDHNAEIAKLRAAMPTTPDSERFEIVDASRVGDHLVLEVLYPNCAKCSYEGNKVLVFLDVAEADVIKWRKLDPHFRDPAAPRQAREAPGPDARFPASEKGWKDALDYARRKNPVAVR